MGNHTTDLNWQLESSLRDISLSWVSSFFARKDRLARHKFESAAAPSLFAGWRLDFGPKSYKAVCYILDYEAVRQKSAGYQVAVALPFKEVYVPDGLPVIPFKTAADQALTLFSNPKPEEVQPIEVPFSELPRDARAGERYEYITLDRILKYRPYIERAKMSVVGMPQPVRQR